MRRLNTGEWIAVTLAVLVILFMFLLSFVLSPFSSLEVVEENVVVETPESTTTPVVVGSETTSEIEVQ